MRQADGDGEVGAKRQPLALRPLRHEHASADVLARRLQERVGRMQHRHVDEARAGAVEERAKARRERGHHSLEDGSTPAHSSPRRGEVGRAKRRPGERPPSRAACLSGLGDLSPRGERNGANRTRANPASDEHVLLARCFSSSFFTSATMSLAETSNWPGRSSFQAADARRSPPPAPCRRRGP